ncbi:MAG: DUF1624 domain-containing protein [Spirosomataceae bacterium]
MSRIQNIDILRGLVIVIMTLDHTRDFVHENVLSIEPTDLSQSNPALFLTRWITHLCAPTFVFLAGVSAYLSMSNNPNISENRTFLIKRGLWLIFVNFTINNFGIFLDIHFSIFFLQVIAAIGFGFLILAAILKLGANKIGLIGGIVLLSHNLFQGISFGENHALNFLWALFMNKGYFQITPSTGVLISYAIIPWSAILLVGFGTAAIISKPQNERQLFKIGMGALLSFIVLRFINLYGDPAPWTLQKNVTMTFLSFINTTKQPPSLLFVLMTLGISFLLLFLFRTAGNKFTKWLSIFGKVPLFYWTIHWFVLHFVAIVYYLGQGYGWQDLEFSGFGFGKPADGQGMSLKWVYVTWIFVVLFMFPLAKLYGVYKFKNSDKSWLRYM